MPLRLAQVLTQLQVTQIVVNVILWIVLYVISQANPDQETRSKSRLSQSWASPAPATRGGALPPLPNTGNKEGQRERA